MEELANLGASSLIRRFLLRDTSLYGWVWFSLACCGFPLVKIHCTHSHGGRDKSQEVDTQCKQALSSRSKSSNRFRRKVQNRKGESSKEQSAPSHWSFGSGSVQATTSLSSLPYSNRLMTALTFWIVFKGERHTPLGILFRRKLSYP